MNECPTCKRGFPPQWSAAKVKAIMDTASALLRLLQVLRFPLDRITTPRDMAVYDALAEFDAALKGGSNGKL